MTVVLYPDYVIYRDSYCTGPRLIFSNNSIKISCTTASEYQEDFDFEWGIDDLINVECQWLQRVNLRLAFDKLLLFYFYNACDNLKFIVLTLFRLKL